MCWNDIDSEEEEQYRFWRKRPRCEALKRFPQGFHWILALPLSTKNCCEIFWVFSDGPRSGCQKIMLLLTPFRTNYRLPSILKESFYSHTNGLTGWWTVPETYLTGKEERFAKEDIASRYNATRQACSSHHFLKTERRWHSPSQLCQA